MTQNIHTINEKIKADSNIKVPEINVGDNVKIVMQLREANPDKKSKSSKTQHIQGLVLAKKHNKELGSAITIRGIVDGVGVEWVIPLYSTDIMKFEVIKSSKVRRAKLYYIRKKSLKEAKSKLRKEVRQVQKESQLAKEEEVAIEEKAEAKEVKE